MKKILFIIIILTLAIPVLLLAAEPVREWKSKSGSPIKASYDASRDTDPATVPLIKDGKQIRVRFDKLSKADQDYVTKVRQGRRSLEDDFGMVEESRGVAVVPTGKQYALLIGVNKYAKPIKSLQYCVKDMELLADCFQKLGVPKENIFLVTDDSSPERLPTGINIRRQIENVTRIMEPDDQLIIAFSGHGVMVEDKSYLCPSDTNLKDINSVVSRDWVFEQLEKCMAKQKIFIIDACRNEIAFGGGKALGQARTLEDPIGADTHGFILIASCDKTQQSWEHPDLKHGVFTYYLAEGLSGAAKDEDGYVSVLNLFQYASAKTKKYVLREYNEVQVPTFRQGDEMTDFCIAKLETPQPTPTTPTPAPVVEQRPTVTPAPVTPTPAPVATPAPVHITTLDKPGKTAGERKTVTVNGVEFAFRWCPPGTFMMGSPTDERDRENDETQHQVTLTKGFLMMETEVTVGMFKAFVSDTGYESKGNTPVGYVNGSLKHDSQFSWRNPGFSQTDNHPVTNVSWNDAVAFCKWLSRKTGQNITLPTEAQWEYACRAGTTGAYAGNLEEMAWYNGYSGTHPVGTKKPNAWGLYDMHGNVWEWCQDWKADYPSGSVTDPSEPSSGSACVIRGGSWHYYARYCRSAYRYDAFPGNRGCGLGFRCVLGQ